MAWLVAVALLAAPAAVGWASGLLDRGRLDRERLLRRGSDPAATTADHGLTPTELAQVEAAVAHGRTLSDPRLRAAAVQWAREVAGPPPRPGDTWFRRALVAGLVVLGVVAAVRGRWAGVPIGWSLQWLLVSSWLASGPRRAIERNSAPPA